MVVHKTKRRISNKISKLDEINFNQSLNKDKGRLY